MMGWTNFNLDSHLYIFTCAFLEVSILNIVKMNITYLIGFYSPLTGFLVPSLSRGHAEILHCSSTLSKAITDAVAK